MPKETYNTIKADLENDPELETFRFLFESTDGHEDWVTDNDFEKVRGLYHDAGVDYTVTEHIFDHVDLWLYGNHDDDESLNDVDFY